MATRACFFRLFAWKIVFQPFTLSQSVSLCLFIGELSQL
uniref:Uncharacterized protein n=1 Tax=Trichinella nativa TaxID=6335 RepID=A0A0V1KHV0_9BILA